MVQLSAPAANSIKDLFPYAVISTPFVGHRSAIIEASTGFKQVPITAPGGGGGGGEKVVVVDEGGAKECELCMQGG